jgi:hypothetical protein
MSDQLKAIFAEQLARLEAELKVTAPHASGQRKPDLAELEAHLPVTPSDERDS